MAFVLCYEIIFGEGVRPHGPAERACLAAEEVLRAAAREQMEAAGVKRVADLVETCTPEPHPRTARLNLLKLTNADALRQLQYTEKAWKYFQSLASAYCQVSLLHEFWMKP